MHAKLKMPLFGQSADYGASWTQQYHFTIKFNIPDEILINSNRLEVKTTFHKLSLTWQILVLILLGVVLQAGGNLQSKSFKNSLFRKLNNTGNNNKNA